MITTIRTISQQLAKPIFDHPANLVKWMGAVQAQNYPMAKWAVGIRSQCALKQVEDSLEKGEILRTHILRPTWHFVAADDIRWMLALSGKRIKAANLSFGKDSEISEKFFVQCNRLLEQFLAGNKSLAKQEIAEKLDNSGIKTDAFRINRIILNAEAEGLVCNGVYKGNKATYGLLEERVAPTKEISKEEALTRLAVRYFKSHSPASAQDFIWWSGLSITEAKQAMASIESELIADKYDGQILYRHQSYSTVVETEDLVHLLPSFDEYLISYKNRTAALPLEHHLKAFNNFGTFYPVIMHNGKIVGNWKKVPRKREITVETSFFDKKTKIDQKLIEAAIKRYIQFIAK